MLINHVRIYGSNVAEGFPAFQCRSCMNLCEMMLRFSAFLNSSFIKRNHKNVFSFSHYFVSLSCVMLYCT